MTQVSHFPSSWLVQDQFVADSGLTSFARMTTAKFVLNPDFEAFQKLFAGLGSVVYFETHVGNIPVVSANIGRACAKKKLTRSSIGGRCYCSSCPFLLSARFIDERVGDGFGVLQITKIYNESFSVRP